MEVENSVKEDSRSTRIKVNWQQNNRLDEEALEQKKYKDSYQMSGKLATQYNIAPEELYRILQINSKTVNK